MREVRHPTVVLIRNVEGHFGRRARAVDEQRDAIGGRSAAQDGSGLHHFAHVDLRGLSGDGRHGGVNLDVVVEAQQAVAVIAKSAGARHRPASNAVAHTVILIVNLPARLRRPSVYVLLNNVT